VEIYCELLLVHRVPEGENLKLQ